MRFLANENFPLESVRSLRAAGHDVAAVIEDSPGAKDHEVLARAAREERIILTFDRDYGELIYRLKHPAPAGIIYLRFAPSWRCFFKMSSTTSCCIDFLRHLNGWV
jgi:predicted nuclease of predicted toxin-antitoxin system